VASSRVFAMMIACVPGLRRSSVLSSPIEKVAVLPVPDCAWAITSRRSVSGLIARCWIAEGRSKPYA